MVSRIETIYKTTLRVSDGKKQDDGLLIVEGFVSEAEKVSPNGYRYKSTFWPKVLSQDYVKDMINSRESLGCEEHPEDDNHYMLTPYSKATHFVKSLELKKLGDSMAPYAKLAVLNTAKGCDLKALVEVKVPLGVSTRGLGVTLSDSISNFIEEEEYRYITHDVVRNPNFSTLRVKAVTDSMIANPLFKELTQAIHLRESGSEYFNREKLLKDIAQLSGELNKKVQLLNQL